MKRILILANHFITIYAFRKELIAKLIEKGNEVYLSLPDSEETSFFSSMGCKIIDTPLERRGTNPISDGKLLLQYIKIIKRVNPDTILTYTIKPNIYGGIASRICKSKVIHTVTGLGSVYIQDIWQKKIIVVLNKIAFKRAAKIYFLNKENREFYEDLKIISEKQETSIVPGSGVNLDEFKFAELPNALNTTFTFVGRVLRDKGIEEFLYAAMEVKKIYENVEFQIVGFVEEKKYIELMKKYEEQGAIEYLGKRNDIHQIMEKSSCVVLPSYGEGRGTVLQEAAAVGRPLITCDTYGCKETVEDGKNGYLCKVADADSLINAIIKVIELPLEGKKNMGKISREKAEKEFDRNIVINAYLDEIMK